MDRAGEFEYISKDWKVPPGSGFAVRMPDASMEPYIHEGSRCFISKEDGLSDGELGLFALNGEFVCRQYCEDCFGNIYLFVLNRKMKNLDAVIRKNGTEKLSFIGKIILPETPPLP